MSGSLALLLKVLDNFFELLQKYISLGCMDVGNGQSQYISDFTLLVDLVLQILEYIRINVSRVQLGHRGSYRGCGISEMK